MVDKPADSKETTPELPAEDTEELTEMPPSGRGPFHVGSCFSGSPDGGPVIGFTASASFTPLGRRTSTCKWPQWLSFAYHR